MSAPKGHQFAKIHGIYSKMITKEEGVQIESMSLDELRGEIAYLRAACGRLARIIEHNGLKHNAAKALDDRTLRMLAAHDHRLETLLRYIRAHAVLSGGESEYDRQIEEGEFLARRRKGVFFYLEDGPTAYTTHGQSAGDDDGSEEVHPLGAGSGPAAVPEGTDHADHGLDPAAPGRHHRADVSAPIRKRRAAGAAKGVPAASVRADARAHRGSESDVRATNGRGTTAIRRGAGSKHAGAPQVAKGGSKRADDRKGQRNVPFRGPRRRIRGARRRPCC